jgi:hypothetical protein
MDCKRIDCTGRQCADLVALCGGVVWCYINRGIDFERDYSSAVLLHAGPLREEQLLQEQALVE